MFPRFHVSAYAAGLAGLCLLLVSAASRSARADLAPPLTPEQTKSLDQALALWTGMAPSQDKGMLGETVAPEGDHYRVAVTPNLTGFGHDVSFSGGTLTATARPLAGGVWVFDDIARQPMIYTTLMPKSGDAMVGKYAAFKQSGHAVIDPSLAAQSIADTRAESQTGSLAIGKLGTATLAGGVLTAHKIWQPAGNGRVDLTARDDVADISIKYRGSGPSATSVDVAVRHLGADLKAAAMSPSQYIALMASMRSTFGSTPSGPATGPLPVSPPPPAATTVPLPSASPSAAALEQIRAAQIRAAQDRARLRVFLEKARGLASSFDGGMMLEDTALSSAGHTVTARRVGFSYGVGAPDGKLDVHFRILLDGLHSADIPPALADFVPSHIVLAQRVTGPSSDQAYDELLHSLDDTGRSPAATKAEMTRLLAHGPLAMKFDEIALDVGQAKLHGVGSIQMVGSRPSDVTASADLDARGFDDLLRHVAANPQLKRALPVLILMKGIGEEHDGVIHWHIVLQGGRILVNGTDLSALRPH